MRICFTSRWSAAKEAEERAQQIDAATNIDQAGSCLSSQCHTLCIMSSSWLTLTFSTIDVAVEAQWCHHPKAVNFGIAPRAPDRYKKKGHHLGDGLKPMLGTGMPAGFSPRGVSAPERDFNGIYHKGANFCAPSFSPGHLASATTLQGKLCGAAAPQDQGIKNTTLDDQTRGGAEFPVRSVPLPRNTESGNRSF